MGSGRSRWQDGRRAWERLGLWHRHVVDRFPKEHPVAMQRSASRALSDVALVRQLLGEVELQVVQAARGAGMSWTEIAAPLGVTRQAAWERWRDLDTGLPHNDRGEAIDEAIDEA